eukprot:TRINITY_DN8636_c0_g1_i2.p1 TRINITY_DN8636_c0_g1~~TRINITY_DN8636_c0_g1_i2.p1  ORF type:complete len:241 (+),score=46.49 TRINITY_DN8636_c0_g1_i2:124-846(+)
MCIRDRYLNVPGYVYSTALVLVYFPWSFKFAFGLINDTIPILGYHRKPYMVIGWSLCSVMMIVLSMHTIPDPYYCRDDDGNYTKIVCNPDAKTKGGEYSLLMLLAALGYVVADVAADGLTVQFARCEPIEKRGSIQTTVYITRTIGQILAQFLVGFGMNGKEYHGNFEHGLTFNQVCGILTIPCVIMIPLSWYCIVEELSLIHISEPTRLLSISYAVFCLKKKKHMIHVNNPNDFGRMLT